VIDEATLLKQQVLALQNSRVASAQWLVGELSNVLVAFAAAADQGNPHAKQALKDFTAALDKARDAAGKLTIVRNGGH
jgi:hypothetical protein